MDEVISVTNGYGCFLPPRFFLGDSLLRGGVIKPQTGFSIRKIPINYRAEWGGKRAPHFQGKGGIPVLQPLLFKYPFPNM
ncbi:unnamed protein product, partial [Vitis vinifera]